MLSIFDTPLFDPFIDPFFIRRRMYPRRVPAYYWIDITPDETDKPAAQADSEKRCDKQCDKHESSEKAPDASPGARDSKNEESKEAPKETPREVSVRTRSVITRRNGIEHVRKESYDSVSGTSTLVETRRIGDKALSLKRETDKDGNVKEEESRENLSDDEVESFKAEWLAKTGAPNASVKPPEAQGAISESKSVSQTEDSKPEDDSKVSA